MNHDISNLNKAFESRVRLGIMAILVVSGSVEFSEVKEKLNITDGNLASHINALEKLKYIEVSKQFVGKKPNTTYKITIEGKNAFSLHLSALESLLKLK